MSDGDRQPATSLAAVLFTDLEASTALRAQLGEDEADAVRRQHDMILTDSVTAYSGTVVKGLGDGIMARFSGASDAVAAAIAIERSIARFNLRSSLPFPLAIRAGISVGEVSEEDGDCFGRPVIEAARLCDAADGGQILVTDLLAALVGERLGDVFSALGSRELKGLDRPVSVEEVDWSGPQDIGTHLSLPPGLAVDWTTPFVGRDAERRTLDSAWARAAAGSVRLALVSGEPGSGKTRLAGELASKVRDAGGIVLHGRCEHHTGTAYHPFVEALDRLVATCRAEDLRASLGSLSGELSRLVPSLAQRMPHLPAPLRAEPETERYRLFEAVTDLLAAVSASDPVLLVFDDLNWADTSTLLLLRHLLRSDQPLRLLVVGTYRHTDVTSVGALSDLAADVRRVDRLVRIRLDGLDLPGVAALAVDAFGRDVDPGFVQSLHRQTAGNAYFVEEVLHQLVESGQPPPQARARWNLAALGIPEGVQDMVGQRLARLDDDVRAQLDVAAVIGDDFDLRLLAAASGHDMGTIITAAGAAEDAHLIVPAEEVAGRYRFSHALVRSVLYNELPAGRRVWLHSQVGLALENNAAGPPRTSELAYHFSAAAGLGVGEQAVKYSRRAGDEARSGLAFEQAALSYQRALDLMPLVGATDVALRCDLRRALGDALGRAGDERGYAVLHEAADDARALDDTARLADIALSFGRTGWLHDFSAVDAKVVALIQEAVDRVGDADSTIRARLLAERAAAMVATSDQDQRVPLSREAVAMARRVGDKPALAAVLTNHHPVVTGPDCLDERLEVAQELVGLGEELGDLTTTFYGHLFNYMTLVETGDVDNADVALSAADDMAVQLRQPYFRWDVTHMRACQALLAGDIERAEQFADAAAQIARQGGVSEERIQIVVGGQMFLLREHQDRLGELVDLFPLLMAAQPDWPIWRVGLAWGYCDSDRSELARPHFEALARDGFAAMPRDIVWPMGMVVLAALAEHFEDTERAAELEQLLLPYAGRNIFGGAGSYGPVDRALGMLAGLLGKTAEADERFAAAVDLCERMHAPGWRARTELDWARTLARRGDRQRARDLASSAAERGARTGMAGVVRRARALAGA